MNFNLKKYKTVLYCLCYFLIYSNGNCQNKTNREHASDRSTISHPKIETKSKAPSTSTAEATQSKSLNSTPNIELGPKNTVNDAQTQQSIDLPIEHKNPSPIPPCKEVIPPVYTPKGNGILVGLPNQYSTNCWINTSLQALHALYRDKILALADSCPLKKMIQDMDAAINNHEKVLSQETFDRFIDKMQEAINQASHKVYENSVCPLCMKTVSNLKKSRGHDFCFLQIINSLYNFMEKVSVYRASDRCNPTLEFETIIYIPTCIDSNKQGDFTTFSYDLFQQPIAYRLCEHYIKGNMPNILIARDYHDRIQKDHLFSIKQIHASYFMSDLDATDSNAAIVSRTDMDHPMDPSTPETSTNSTQKQDFIPIHLTLEALLTGPANHVYAYIKKGDKWYQANDTSIMEIKEEIIWNDAKTNGAVFFYKKR